MVDYALIRSKRKTAALCIRNGCVEVRAPMRMPKRDIDRFVASKEQWIADKLAQSQNRAAQREAFARDHAGDIPSRIQEYRTIAKTQLPELVASYATRMGVTPAAVKVNGAKTRWGSCSSKGNLNFSWRLMMADDGVVDYLVVHELAHLKEMNHSSRFWAIVQNVLPDYKERQKQLRALQKRLSCENWD
jgi:hypothetical protein